MARFVGVFLVVGALIFGGVMYYTQVYAFYDEVSLQSEPRYPGQNEMTLVSVATGMTEPMIVDDFTAIDAGSSPLKFRACFTTPTSTATLTETYVTLADGEAIPLTAPKWFDCFDAVQIGNDIESGKAVAFMGRPEIEHGVNRVVAVYPDGQAFAWHQLTEEYQEK
ncbi:MAG: DUF6446 family protein [Brevirhabdus sp.]